MGSEVSFIDKHEFLDLFVDDEGKEINKLLGVFVNFPLNDGEKMLVEGVGSVFTRGLEADDVDFVIRLQLGGAKKNRDKEDRDYIYRRFGEYLIASFDNVRERKREDNKKPSSHPERGYDHLGFIMEFEESRSFHLSIRTAELEFDYESNTEISIDAHLYSDVVDRQLSSLFGFDNVNVMNSKPVCLLLLKDGDRVMTDGFKGYWIQLEKQI